MKRIEHNVETGEVLEIELTPVEIAEFETIYAQTAKENEVAQAEAQAKAAQRQALLDKLGITEDEARLLLGGN
jgi:hypothetical protein